MNGNQKKAIKAHWKEIIEVFQVVIDYFLNFLIRNSLLQPEMIEIVKNEPSATTKAANLIEILTTYDNGWQAIIDYLSDNNSRNLAKKLQAAAAAAGPTGLEMCTEKDFIEKLTNYYTYQYSQVRTVFGCSRDVNEVWVPLKVEETTKSPIQNDNLSHCELLKRLADSSNSVALVKGHPGVGKTTLVQKIAYDWATKKAVQFDLILTVPLRHVGKTSDFLDLTADYYTNRLQVFPSRKDELLQWLKGLGKKLLICFDGLDEYGSLAESPFKPMFQQLEATDKPCPILFIPYKLLITSRPYACAFINRDFSPLKFEISPLDEAHLADFIEHYCETDEGKMNVTNYLEDHSDLVIKVPLILTFVCYLAEKIEEIPTNLTFLYDKMLGHMVKREIESNCSQLIEKIKADQWKESAVVKWTAQLAFEGCQTDKFEFRPSLDLDVAKDSFACGFLLHKFSFREQRLKAEFAHRSVQEFFAALYCYQLTSTTDKSGRNFVLKEIFKKDSQFGRFVFGLCSVERNFEEMLDWLNPTFGDVSIIDNRIDDFLERLSDCLSDCSEAELFGQRLAASFDQFENQIQKEREERTFWLGSYLDLPLSNRRFQSGLNLNRTGPHWSISHVDKPRSIRLTCVRGDLQVDLLEKFDKIQILFWGCAYAQLAGMISSVDLLPEVSTLIIYTGYNDGFEVNFHLEYETTTTTPPTSATTQLRHFCFQFGKREIEDLKKKKNFKDQLVTDGLIIGELHRTGEEKEISWVTVTVKNSSDRTHLLRNLISMALEILSTASVQRVAGNEMRDLSIPDRIIKVFKANLADYYVSKYSTVRIMFGCRRDVNKIRVRLEEKTRSLRQEDNFDHIGLLERLADKEFCSVALVKGHPGVGKTTLVHKIAYDWATKKALQFDLILTVPLRYVGPTSDFLDLTADYYINHLQISPVCKKELLVWLKGLGKRLLVCFDGLDEYGSLADSPFTQMVDSVPALFSYSLLVTSRPYICEFMTRSFPTLTFEIYPLDQIYLEEFIRLYCLTDSGYINATHYVNHQISVDIQVPLILMFICCLADKTKEIPTKLTLLYDNVIREMVNRGVSGKQLAEKINSENWKESEVVKSTAALAFEGCKNEQLEFDLSTQKLFGVNEDSFTCGFLLQKFDFKKCALLGEFLHRSIQEYFAALHCCHQLVSTGGDEEINFVKKELLKTDSQFGRFFFGIWSNEQKKFEQMLNWLKPTFGDAGLVAFNFGSFLTALSNASSDCSEAYLLGKTLAASIDELNIKFTAEDNEMKCSDPLPSLEEPFKSGLNLQFLDNKRFPSWTLSSPNDPKTISRLINIFSVLPVDLGGRFKQIDIFMWQWSNLDMAELISALDGLPSVSTLIVLPHPLDSYQVNFTILYEEMVGELPEPVDSRLEHFTIGFHKWEVQRFAKELSNETAGEDFIWEKLLNTTKPSVHCLKITIRSGNLKRSKLIEELVRLALQCLVYE